MTTIISPDTTDDLVPLRLTCQCPSGRRVLPIRMARGAIKLFNGGLDPSTLIQTYRCPDCQHVVSIRAGHLNGGLARNTA